MSNINIKATNLKLSPSVQAYVNKNMAKVEKFLRPENSIHVEVELEPKHHSGMKYRVEMLLMPKSEMYAEARGNDFYEAIDLCLPKFKEQLMKNKDREVSLRRKLGAKRKRTA